MFVFVFVFCFAACFLFFVLLLLLLLFFLFLFLLFLFSALLEHGIVPGSELTSTNRKADDFSSVLATSPSLQIHPELPSTQTTCSDEEGGCLVHLGRHLCYYHLQGRCPFSWTHCWYSHVCNAQSACSWKDRELEWPRKKPVCNAQYACLCRWEQRPQSYAMFARCSEHGCTSTA